MKKILISLILLAVCISCRQNTPEEPSDAQPAHTTEAPQDHQEATLTSANGEPSAISVALNNIMDQAVERMLAAKTTDEVVEAANWYYDTYWEHIFAKGIEWTKDYTQEEKQAYNQRDKEFVMLIRTRYLELGGNKKDLQATLKELMIKCMKYDQQMKAQWGDAVQDSIAASHAK
jgi:hypothetical protein